MAVCAILQSTEHKNSFAHLAATVKIYTTANYKLRCSGMFQAHRNYPLEYTFEIRNKNDSNIGK